MYRIIPTILLGALLAAPAWSAPVVIDFESLAEPGEGNTAEGNVYFEDAMRITDVDGQYELSVWKTDTPGFTGSTALFNNSRNATTELTVNGGGTFDLVSIDLAPLSISYNLVPEVDLADSVFVTFVTNTGHAQTFDVGITDGNWVYDDFWEIWYTDTQPPVTTFNFDDGFRGVSSVSWIQEDPGPHQFDNITLANIIPLPPAAMLFVSALAGLGVWRQRSTQAAAAKRE